MQAYKKGVFNYIKEDIDQTNQQPMPRKHFSGGASAMTVTHLRSLAGLKFSSLYQGALLFVKSIATRKNSVGRNISKISKILSLENFL